jgi:hypothetical protein
MFLPSIRSGATSLHQIAGALNARRDQVRLAMPPTPQPRQSDRRISHLRRHTDAASPERRSLGGSGRGLRRLPGPVPKASASRRGLPRIRSTSCPCIIFRPREPGIGLVARRGIRPPVIPPSFACGLLQFFRCRASGECPVGWRLRTRHYGSGILFRWVGDGELSSRVLSRVLDRN